MNKRVLNGIGERRKAPINGTNGHSLNGHVTPKSESRVNGHKSVDLKTDPAKNGTRIERKFKLTEDEEIYILESLILFQGDKFIAANAYAAQGKFEPALRCLETAKEAILLSQRLNKVINYFEL
jgi:hypothetical protein